MDKQKRLPIYIALVVLNLVVLMSWLTMQVYDGYPNEKCRYDNRVMFLEGLNQELVHYCAREGHYPDTLQRLLTWDKDRKIKFDGKDIDRWSLDWRLKEGDLDINDYFQYDASGATPILTDLGIDGKPGGDELAFDVVYPASKENPIRFSDFTNTTMFWPVTVRNLVFSTILSVCLLGMFRSIQSIGGLFIASMGFLFLEYCVAIVIMYAEVYPHH